MPRGRMASADSGQAMLVIPGGLAVQELVDAQRFGHPFHSLGDRAGLDASHPLHHPDLRMLLHESLQLTVEQLGFLTYCAAGERDDDILLAVMGAACQKERPGDSRR